MLLERMGFLLLNSMEAMYYFTVGSDTGYQGMSKDVLNTLYTYDSRKSMSEEVIQELWEVLAYYHPYGYSGGDIIYEKLPEVLKGRYLFVREWDKSLEVFNLNMLIRHLYESIKSVDDGRLTRGVLEDFLGASVYYKDFLGRPLRMSISSEDIYDFGFTSFMKDSVFNKVESTQEKYKTYDLVEFISKSLILLDKSTELNGYMGSNKGVVKTSYPYAMDYTGLILRGLRRLYALNYLV